MQEQSFSSKANQQISRYVTTRCLKSLSSVHTQYFKEIVIFYSVNTYNEMSVPLRGKGKAGLEQMMYPNNQK